MNTSITSKNQALSLVPAIVAAYDHAIVSTSNFSRRIAGGLRELEDNSATDKLVRIAHQNLWVVLQELIERMKGESSRLNGAESLNNIVKRRGWAGIKTLQRDYDLMQEAIIDTPAKLLGYYKLLEKDMDVLIELFCGENTDIKKKAAADFYLNAELMLPAHLEEPEETGGLNYLDMYTLFKMTDADNKSFALPHLLLRGNSRKKFYKFIGRVPVPREVTDLGDNPFTCLIPLKEPAYTR